jgi:hypothetical protein
MGQRYFSRLDLADAFFRISVPKKWRHLTAFEVGGRHYQFRRMPFGLKTAPAIFQRYMDHVLAPFSDWCIAYIDDILISAKSLAQLRRRVDKVKHELARQGSTINERKCEHDKEGLLFAGMWIYHGGQGPNHLKVKEVIALARPRTKVEKQSALGLVSYLRDHVPLASHFTAELYPKKEGAISEDDYTKRWTALIRQIAKNITTLSTWDEDADASLYCDGSGQSVSALILQHGRLVALASRKLSPAETRYSATDREHLALVLAAKKFRVFLHRPKGQTTVFSDHAALLSRSQKEMTPRQTRWATIVNQWIPHVKHVKGKENPADYPSRWGLEVEGGQISSI